MTPVGMTSENRFVYIRQEGTLTHQALAIHACHFNTSDTENTIITDHAVYICLILKTP